MSIHDSEIAKYKEKYGKPNNYPISWKSGDGEFTAIFNNEEKCLFLISNAGTDTIRYSDIKECELVNDPKRIQKIERHYGLTAAVALTGNLFMWWGTTTKEINCYYAILHLTQGGVILCFDKSKMMAETFKSSADFAIKLGKTNVKIRYVETKSCYNSKNLVCALVSIVLVAGVVALWNLGGFFRVLFAIVLAIPTLACIFFAVSPMGSKPIEGQDD